MIIFKINFRFLPSIDSYRLIGNNFGNRLLIAGTTMTSLRIPFSVIILSTVPLLNLIFLFVFCFLPSFTKNISIPKSRWSKVKPTLVNIRFRTGRNFGFSKSFFLHSLRSKNNIVSRFYNRKRTKNNKKDKRRKKK